MAARTPFKPSQLSAQRRVMVPLPSRGGMARGKPGTTPGTPSIKSKLGTVLPFWIGNAEILVYDALEGQDRINNTGCASAYLSEIQTAQALYDTELSAEQALASMTMPPYSIEPSKSQSAKTRTSRFASAKEKATNCMTGQVSSDGRGEVEETFTEEDTTPAYEPPAYYPSATETVSGSTEEGKAERTQMLMLAGLGLLGVGALWFFLRKKR